MKSKSQSSEPGDRRKRNVMIVDDHPLTRTGLGQLIDKQPDLQVCCEAGSRPEALTLLSKSTADLVVTDLSIPGGGGFELLKDLRALYPKTLALVLTMHDETIHSQRALRAGARGYVMKEAGAETVLAAIRTVMSGKVYLSSRMEERLLDSLSGNSRLSRVCGLEGLSDRELQVFQLIGEGKSSKEIALELKLSPKTVDVHRARIKEKLGCKDTVSLLRFAVTAAEKLAEPHASAVNKPPL